MSGEIVLTIPDLRAGAMWRRTVRYAIRSAKVLGAQVDVAEQWALLGSQFTIRAVGTHEALKPLIALTALVDPEKTRQALDQLTR